jgi:DNA-binding transcriptional LysR family regulator
LAVEVTTDEAFEVVVSRADPWRRRTWVSVETLVQRPLIALPVGTGIRRRLDEACAVARVSARVAFEASTPIELADLAESGLGPAIVPQSVARARPDLHSISIVPELRGRLVLAWRASAPISPAAAALVNLAREHVRVGGRA